jgi:hypothetical protein
MGQASTPSGLRTMPSPFQVGPASTHALQPREDIPRLTERTSLHPSESGGYCTLTDGSGLHTILPQDHAHALTGRTSLHPRPPTSGGYLRLIGSTSLHPSDSGGYSTLTGGSSLHTFSCLRTIPPCSIHGLQPREDTYAS